MPDAIIRTEPPFPMSANVKTEPPLLTAANIEGDPMEVHLHGDADEPGAVWLSVAYASPAEVGLDMLTEPAGLSAEQAVELANRLLDLAGQAGPEHP